MATSSTPCTTIYKILTPSEFTSLPLPPTLWTGTPFDLSSAPLSVHICSSLRLPITLLEVFSDPSITNLWLLAIPRTERIESMLTWVESTKLEGGWEMCGNLNVGEGIDAWSEVAVRRPIVRGSGGVWDVGEVEW